jgi:(2S)-methylsuccinyl-CoA dehydrogenase
MPAPLDVARTLTAACREVVDGGLRRLATDTVKDGRVSIDLLDREQQLAYDLASTASRVAAAEEMLAYGEKGELEAQLTLAFAGEVAADLAARVAGREPNWDLGADAAWHGPDVAEALRAARDTTLLEELGETVLRSPELPRHLGEEMELVRGTFKDYAESKVMPIAEHIHREDADIPDEIIAELAEMGCFGLSIPEEHGGFAEGGRHRGAVARFAGGGRVVDHPAGDPVQGAGQRRHGRAEGAVAAGHRLGRADVRRGGDRTRLRLRRRRHQGQRHPQR